MRDGENLNKSARKGMAFWISPQLALKGLNDFPAIKLQGPLTQRPSLLFSLGK